jgi:hypothetical protein
MTVRIPEDILAWSVDWSLVTIMGDMLPPRDPNDDDDEDEEDEEDETPHDQEAEPAVIREQSPDQVIGIAARGCKIAKVVDGPIAKNIGRVC